MESQISTSVEQTKRRQTMDQLSRMDWHFKLQATNQEYNANSA